MTPREEYVAEIHRLTAARNKSRSRYLRIDYDKAIMRKQRQLRNYDRYQQEARHDK